MSSTFSVFLGLDVGKDSHHAVGLDPGGKRLHDAPLSNTEPKLRALFDKLAARGAHQRPERSRWSRCGATTAAATALRLHR